MIQNNKVFFLSWTFEAKKLSLCYSGLSYKFSGRKLGPWGYSILFTKNYYIKYSKRPYIFFICGQSMVDRTLKFCMKVAIKFLYRYFIVKTMASQQGKKLSTFPVVTFFWFKTTKCFSCPELLRPKNLAYVTQGYHISFQAENWVPEGILFCLPKTTILNIQNVLTFSSFAAKVWSTEPSNFAWR